MKKKRLNEIISLNYYTNYVWNYILLSLSSNNCKIRMKFNNGNTITLYFTDNKKKKQNIPRKDKQILEQNIFKLSYKLHWNYILFSIFIKYVAIICIYFDKIDQNFNADQFLREKRVFLYRVHGVLVERVARGISLFFGFSSRCPRVLALLALVGQSLILTSEAAKAGTHSLASRTPLFRPRGK